MGLETFLAGATLAAVRAPMLLLVQRDLVEKEAHAGEEQLRHRRGLPPRAGIPENPPILTIQPFKIAARARSQPAALVVLDELPQVVL